MRPAIDRSHLRLAFTRGPEPTGMPPFSPGRRPTRPLTPPPSVNLTTVDWFGLGSFIAVFGGCAVGWFLATRYAIALVFGP